MVVIDVDGRSENDQCCHVQTGNCPENGYIRCHLQIVLGVIGVNGKRTGCWLR